MNHASSPSSSSPSSRHTRRTRAILFATLCLALVAGGGTFSRAAVTLDCTIVSGPELKRQSGRLARLDDEKLQLASADGRQGIELALANVAWIEFNASASSPQQAQPQDPTAATPRPFPRRGPRRTLGNAPIPAPTAGGNNASSGDFLLVLRDGERLRGTPGAIGSDTLTFRTRSFGERSIPVAEIAGWSRTNAGDEGELLAATLIGLPGRAALTQDELRLTNGDLVTGVVASADAEQVTVQTPDGQSVPIDWANVRQVRLAVLPGTETTEDAGASAAKAALIVRTLGGEMIRCSSASMNDDAKLAVKFAAAGGGEGSIAGSDLRSIELQNGKVRLLTSLKPAQRTYAPFFPPATGDASAAAIERPQPPSVTIGGKTTRAFVLARPKSKITWNLPVGDAAAGRFITRYGIGDARRYANATVRVYVDDKLVHEKAGVTSGQLSDPVDVPVRGAHTLSLEVDYGDAFDVQDEVAWFEPILVRD